MTTVWIRADASTTIGAGHIMRCIALAVELREADVTVRFICRELEGDLIALLNKRSFVVEVISGGPDFWTIEKDAAKTREVIEKYDKKADWVIVDLLDNRVEWDSAIRPVTEKILAIDDHASRQRDCDIMVNPHFFPQAGGRYKKLTPSGCIILAGLEHLLIRREFLTARQEGLIGSANEVKNILVSFGGSDCEALLDKVVEALLPLGSEDIEVDIILGAGDQEFKNSRDFEGTNIRCHDFVDDMVKIVKKADLVIGAYGVSTAERMLLGTPSIMITISDHQVALAKMLADAGYAVYLGPEADMTPEIIAKTVNRLKSDIYKLRSISNAIMDRVDGLGAQRVVKRMGL